MSKILQSSLLQIEQKYQNLPQQRLEQLRCHGEELLSRSERKAQVTGALEQSIAARILNQKYATTYDIADFDEHGQIVMQSTMNTKRNRALPELRMTDTQTTEYSLS